MQLIESVLEDPPRPISPPPIDAVRPRCCAACGAVAGAGAGLLMHGHGVRQALVAIPPPHWQGVARMVTVPLRRFRCTRCGATVTVHPRGVLPRQTYSLFAVLFAWWSACKAPIGQGRDDPAVCALQGVDRRAADGPECRTRSGRRRWRSLARWAAKIGEWWPGRAVAGTTWRDRVASLLAGFAAEAGGAEVAGLLARAVAGHAGSGAAM